MPSVADLLEGAPITTRGYSWDYTPAWRHTSLLRERPEVDAAKLFRGRNTLISRRLWPAVASLSRRAVEAVLDGRGGDERREVLELVRANRGIPGEEVKACFGWSGREGSRAFQRAKTDLERWLCVVGAERNDVDYHTHDSAWSEFSLGKLGRALSRRSVLPSLEESREILLRAVYPDAVPPTHPRVTTLFPVLGLLGRKG